MLLRGLVRSACCWMNDHLTLFSDAHTLGPNARHIFERQVHNAAFARRHRIEAERLFRGLYALGGHARRHPQLFKPQCAVTAAVEMDFFVKGGLDPQSAKRKMLERFQHFGTALEQDFLVAPIKIGNHFGLTAGIP